MNLCCNSDFVKRLRKQFVSVSEKRQGGSNSKSHYTMYGLTQCPYCSAAQSELNKRQKTSSATYKIHMLPSEASNADRADFRSKVARAHPSYNSQIHTTFPIIFKNGEFIGGYEDLMKSAV